jgi:hypothetical protein
MAKPVQPFRHRGWGENRDIPVKARQRSEGKVIGMRMRHEDGVYVRQLVQRYPWRAHPGQEHSEGGVKVGVGEECLPTDLY